MAINYYFFNSVDRDRLYNAEDISNYLKGIIGNGIMPYPADCLQVVAGTGMQVVVKAGVGFIDGHKLENTADYPLTVLAAEATLNRIDRVIMYVDHTNRKMGIKYKAGVADAVARPPELVRNQDMMEYCLAEVRVVKQATSIMTSNITDTRLNSAVCGVVQGLIQQVDTGKLFEQQNASFNDMLTKNQSSFDTWFKSAKDEINNDAIVQQISELKTKADDASDIAHQASSSLDIHMLNLKKPTAIVGDDVVPDTTGKMKYVDVNGLDTYDIALVRVTIGTVGDQIMQFHKGMTTNSAGKMNQSFSCFLNDTYSGCVTIECNFTTKQVGIRCEAVKGWTVAQCKIVSIWGIKI